MGAKICASSTVADRGETSSEESTVTTINTRTNQFRDRYTPAPARDPVRPQRQRQRSVAFNLRDNEAAQEPRVQSWPPGPQATQASGIRTWIAQGKLATPVNLNLRPAQWSWNTRKRAASVNPEP